MVARSLSNPSNMIASSRKKSAKVHSQKTGRGGRGGDDFMTSFSNKEYNTHWNGPVCGCLCPLSKSYPILE